jgi:hypothetical protein
MLGTTIRPMRLACYPFCAEGQRSKGAEVISPLHPGPSAKRGVGAQPCWAFLPFPRVIPKKKFGRSTTSYLSPFTPHLCPSAPDSPFHLRSGKAHQRLSISSSKPGRSSDPTLPLSSTSSTWIKLPPLFSYLVMLLASGSTTQYSRTPCLS